MQGAQCNFFKKNGRTLKALNVSTNNASYKNNVETIETLFGAADTAFEETSTIALYKPSIKDKISNVIFFNKYATAGVMVAFILCIGVFVNATVFSIRARPVNSTKYAIYASKPLTIEQSTSSVRTRDSRSQKINAVYRNYKCPMEGLGETFVNEADKNDIPWWLVASVAFKESSCGKNMPTVDGKNSFNAWGWGVYGGNVAMFDNWARGIETVSKYFGDKFFSKGVTDPCEIMKTYTPPSNGSWCEDVKAFAQELQDYETPDD